MSNDFSPVLKAVLGAAGTAACYSLCMPLSIAAGANILAACGHGAAYKLGLLAYFKAVSGWAAVFGAPIGCCGSVCSSSSDDDEKSSKGDVVVGAGLTAAVGATAASKGGLAMTAAQAAAAGATGAGAIAAGGIALVLGGLIVGGTLYCFKEGAKGCINCFKVDKNGGEEVTREELARALEASLRNATALNPAQAQQAVRATIVPKPAYTGAVVGRQPTVASKGLGFKYR